MLARAVLDAALALDRPLVVDVDVEAHAGEGLALLLRDAVAVVVVAANQRPVVGNLVELQPLLAQPLVLHPSVLLPQDPFDPQHQSH